MVVGCSFEEINTDAVNRSGETRKECEARCSNLFTLFGGVVWQPVGFRKEIKVTLELKTCEFAEEVLQELKSKELANMRVVANKIVFNFT